jgi:hypothetical protein
MKNELNTCFQQKFATGSYGVGIGCAWCSRKACEICSSLVSFWSQGILGVKKCMDIMLFPFIGYVKNEILKFCQCFK